MSLYGLVSKKCILDFLGAEIDKLNSLNLFLKLLISVIMKKVSCNETTVFLGKMLSDITGFLVIHVMSINTSVSICSLVHCVVCRSIV